MAAEESCITWKLRRHNELLDNQHLYSGEIARPHRATAQSFEQITYAKMIGMVCEAIRQYPDAPVKVVRVTDHQEHESMLDELTKQRIKDDPVDFIRDPIGVKQYARAYQASPVVRTDYDTLAEAFGDDVYLPMVAVTERVACWNSPWDGTEQRGAIGPELRIDLGKGVTGQIVETYIWARVSVEDLIRAGGSRFYLPCPWNENGPWISFSELHDKYMQFKLTQAEGTKDAHRN